MSPVNNSINIPATNNADGFDLTGGTTARKLTVSGADITIAGSGAYTYTFPGSTCTLCNNTLSNLGTTAITAALTSTFAVTGAALSITDTSTAYTTLVGIVDVTRTGALTGVATETLTDIYLHPSFTLTEPGSGTVNYYGAMIDMSGLAVTAGAGTSVVAGLYIKADDDADTGTNYALLVDLGNSRFDGEITIGNDADNVSGKINFIASDGDAADISITTADALAFANASLYTFDNVINQSPGIGTAGAPAITSAFFYQASGTFTDNATAQSGTALLMAFNTFNTPTLAATNLTVTTTDASTVYIAGAPTNGTNQTITNPWSLCVESGNVRFDGELTIGNDADNVSGKIKFIASDGDAADIAINTSDQLTFNNAGGGYVFDAQVDVHGGLRGNVTDVNAATYDTVVTDYILGCSYTATGAITSLTLPTAQLVEGRTIIVKDTGGLAATNNITIDTEGGEKIDGSDTYVMNSNYQAITLFSNGTNWFII